MSHTDRILAVGENEGCRDEQEDEHEHKGAEAPPSDHEDDLVAGVLQRVRQCDVRTLECDDVIDINRTSGIYAVIATRTRKVAAVMPRGH